MMKFQIEKKKMKNAKIGIAMPSVPCESWVLGVMRAVPWSGLLHLVWDRG